jgi:hypothetical protein
VLRHTIEIVEWACCNLYWHTRMYQGILKGKYHCAIDLLFNWFGLFCFANKNKNCQLSHSWFQTSQTGSQRYSDNSPFSIPYMYLGMLLLRLKHVNLPKVTTVESIIGSILKISIRDSERMNQHFIAFILQKNPSEKWKYFTS